jgi:putative transposase
VRDRSSSLGVLTKIKNRGVTDVCMVVRDGLKGLPDSIITTWAFATVQTCIIHLIRNTFCFASKADWEKIARDLLPVYTAINAEMAAARFAEFNETWGRKYPAISKLWTNARNEFIGVPRLRHRNPAGHLLNQRDREPECPISSGRACPRPLPNRASRTEMPLPSNKIIRPHRERQSQLDHPLETSTQRVRNLGCCGDFGQRIDGFLYAAVSGWR